MTGILGILAEWEIAIRINQITSSSRYVFKVLVKGKY